MHDRHGASDCITDKANFKVKHDFNAELSNEKSPVVLKFCNIMRIVVADLILPVATPIFIELRLNLNVGKKVIRFFCSDLPYHCGNCQCVHKRFRKTAFKATVTSAFCYIISQYPRGAST